VVASSASWWLTELAVGRSAKRAIADKGTMVRAELLTGEPVAWSRRAGLIGPLDTVVAGAVATALVLAETEVTAPAGTLAGT
jgi:hypothetical protein